jgi:hypothetical protein
MRFRHIYTILGTFLVTLAWILTDPDLGLITGMTFGVSTVATFMILAKAMLYVSLLHLSRKALFDYLDISEYFIKAKENPQSAAIALIAVSIFTLAIAVVIYAGTVG